MEIFATKLSLKDQILTGLEILFWLAISLTVLSGLNKEEWVAILLIAVVSLLLLVRAARSLRTYHLTKDTFTIKWPYTYLKGTDTVIKVSDLQEITFRQVPGRFGGPHIIIRAKRFLETYRIDLKEETINDFVYHLRMLTVNVVRDGL